MNKFFIHIDADAFFASVEQCLHPELRGKPIVTGRDGSIAVAMSYEAKALGVERATPIHIIRKEFPTVQMVASDYFMYRIYSNRMRDIIKSSIPGIKRKSIDECSADISDLVHSFEEARLLALKIKHDLEQKLRCSFSVGISSSSLLSKMASGMNKPSGLTIINPKENSHYRDLPLKKVSGLGRKLCHRLSIMGVIRIKDFISQYPKIKKNFSITVDDIYHELQGIPSARARKEKPQQSMNKARSFKVTFLEEEIFGQLLLNLDSLMKKMRVENLICSKLHISLGDQNRERTSSSINLHKKNRDSKIIYELIRILFDDVYVKNKGYRYVSITLSGLEKNTFAQPDLFGESVREKDTEKLYTLIDSLDAKFGRPMVSFATTLSLPKSLGSHVDTQKNPITMMNTLLPNETFFRRLRYPFLGKVY